MTPRRRIEALEAARRTFNDAPNRWLAKQLASGSPDPRLPAFLALIPRWRACGHKLANLSDADLDLMGELVRVAEEEA